MESIKYDRFFWAMEKRLSIHKLVCERASYDALQMSWPDGDTLYRMVPLALHRRRHLVIHRCAP